LYSIYKEGGIYVDTDIEMVTTFDDLLKEKSFVGFQGRLESEKYPLNSAVIGGEKGNEFILDCIKVTEEKQRLNFNAMGGPPIVSKVLFNFFNLDNFVDDVSCTANIFVSVLINCYFEYEVNMVYNLVIYFMKSKKGTFGSQYWEC
jgi:mannosyltransferase OCH1-like enzyme